MKVKDMFPSRWLAASDIPNDQEFNLTIEGIEIAVLNDEGTETKPAVTFRGAQKRLLLNKENAGRIARMYGDDSDNWIGQVITLFVDQVSFRGKIVDGIRVKIDPTKLPGRAAPSDAPSDDHCPF